MNVSLYLCFLIIILFGLLLYKHITRNFNHWKIQNVPSLSPVPIFGNIWRVAALKQSLGHFIQDVYNYADVKFTGFYVFDQPFLLIRDPELIKIILIRDFDHFKNRSLVENRRDDETGSNLLFSIKNPTWKLIRTKLTPIFTTGKLKSMLPLMLEVSDDMVNFINKSVLINGDEMIESREMSMKLTTDVISSCAFGINPKSFNDVDSEFRTAARRFFSFSILRGIQMSSYLLAPLLVKLFRMKFMDGNSSNFMRAVFWKFMHQREISKVKRGDLLDILIQMREQDYDFLDDDILAAQTIQFFIAGMETTGGTVTFALYELALHPEIQNRLRKEIKEVLAKYGVPSYEAIMSMKYLDNVVNETLRKFPALSFLERRCTKSYTIPNSDVTIEAGIPIYISLLGLHMDPKYFPQPEKFDPDRFTDKNRQSILPFTFMPFGDGPRNCIGSRFGLLNAKTALISIISKFEVLPHSTTPTYLTLKYDPRAGFLVIPKGAVMNLCYKKCP